MSSFEPWRKHLLNPFYPEYLRAHVLHLCGAAEYMRGVEMGTEVEGTLRQIVKRISRGTVSLVQIGIVS